MCVDERKEKNFAEYVLTVDLTKKETIKKMLCSKIVLWLIPFFAWTLFRMFQLGRSTILAQAEISQYCKDCQKVINTHSCSSVDEL